MSSLASRLLGSELLTLPEFAHEIVTRLGYEAPELQVTQPRPDLLAAACAGKPAVEFDLRSSYRAYQKDPRSRDAIIKRLLRWIETSVGRRP